MNEEIIEKAHNKSPKEIGEIIDLARESMRQYFSRLCNGKSEEEPLELDVDIEGTCGLSEAEKIKYLSCFEDSEGIIWFNIGGIYDEDVECMEFDEIRTDDLFHIMDNYR